MSKLPFQALRLNPDGRAMFNWHLPSNQMRILGDAIKKSLANKAIVKIQHREIDTISNCFDKVSTEIHFYMKFMHFKR